MISTAGEDVDSDVDDAAVPVLPSSSPRAQPELDDDDPPAPAQQFERILRRLSVGPQPGSVALEFKSFSMPTIPEQPALGSDVDALEAAVNAGLDDDSKDELMLEIQHDLAEEAAVREAEVEFDRRQKAMARNIRDYGRTITLKEERLRELEVPPLIAVDSRLNCLPTCS